MSDRRAFLRTLGAAAGGAALPALPLGAAPPAARSLSPEHAAGIAALQGVLYDLETEITWAVEDGDDRLAELRARRTGVESVLRHMLAAADGYGADRPVIHAATPDMTRRLRWASSEAERVFAARWAEENVPHPGVSYGGGILQDLMVDHETRQWRYAITARDAEIVATVIQWLGTNVGGGFLWETNRRLGLTTLRLP